MSLFNDKRDDGFREAKDSHLACSSADPTSETATDYSHVNFDPEEEKRVVRKVDLALLPGLTLLYLLSFLDRTNVGNARLLGLLTDLKIIDSSDYNTALALFFLGYVLLEVPSQAVLKRTNPKFWLPTITIAWGIVAICQAFVKNRGGFFVARFFMGAAEAGLFPGVVFVFSMYYKRSERHWRVAIFFSGAAIAGSFGGLLAYGIGHIVDVGSLKPWGWLYVIEGSFTVLVGITAYWWVPTYAHNATFLSERERDIVLARLARDSDSANSEEFKWKGVWAAFTDHLVLAYSFMFHGFAFPLYSLSLFLPTIISQLGYASWKAQLLTVPPYAAATIAILLAAYGSHKMNSRASWIIMGGAFAIVGYTIFLTTHTAAARYVGVFITVIGIYVSNALLLSWPSENVSPQTKRAIASGMQIFIGDIGAISGVLIYRPSLNANFFRTPHLIAVGYTSFGMLSAVYLYLFMRKENQRRMLIRANRTSEEGASSRIKEEVEADRLKGDRSDDYIYQL